MSAFESRVGRRRPVSCYATTASNYYYSHDPIGSGSGLHLKVDDEHDPHSARAEALHCLERLQSPTVVHDVDALRTRPCLVAPTSTGWPSHVPSPVYATPDDIPSSPTSNSLNSPSSAMSTPAVTTPTSPSWWHTAAPLPTDRKPKRSSTFSLSRLANAKPNRWVRRLTGSDSTAHCPSSTASEDEEDDLEEQAMGKEPLVTSFGAYRLRLD